MDRVIVSIPMIGITGMQVCCVKDATDKEILELCNKQNPAGTKNGWSEVIRKGNKHGYAEPVQCDEHEERLHILVSC